MRVSKLNKILGKSFLLFGMVVLMVSCSSKTFDSREELMAYVTDSDNGYVQHKNINGVDFSITYRPTDVLVHQELMDTTSKEELDSLRNKYGKYMYFNLSISKNNKEVLNSINSSRADFGAMVNQLAFGMGDKVHLIGKHRDTVELLDYIYPREYGMGGATTMMFVYPREEKVLNDDFFQFTIEDIGLKTGEVGFKIPSKPINNEPKLNFSTR